MSDLIRPEELGDLEQLAELFKAFANPTRLKILNAMSEGEICVTDLAEEVGMTQSAISHQLRILKTNRLIRSRRDGKLIYYSLDDDHVYKILRMGQHHICE